MRLGWGSKKKNTVKSGIPKRGTNLPLLHTTSDQVGIACSVPDTQGCWKGFCLACKDLFFFVCFLLVTAIMVIFCIIGFCYMAETLNPEWRSDVVKSPAMVWFITAVFWGPWFMVRVIFCWWHRRCFTFRKCRDLTLPGLLLLVLVFLCTSMLAFERWRRSHLSGTVTTIVSICSYHLGFPIPLFVYWSVIPFTAQNLRIHGELFVQLHCPSPSKFNGRFTWKSAIWMREISAFWSNYSDLTRPGPPKGSQ